MDYFLSKPVYKQGLGQLLKEAGLIKAPMNPSAAKKKKSKEHRKADR